MLSQGVRVIARHIKHLHDTTKLKLEPRDAEALAKILTALNVIGRDKRKADQEDDGEPAEPEAIVKQLINLIGIDALKRLIRLHEQGAL